MQHAGHVSTAHRPDDVRLKREICLVYLDDIIVFSKELPDHLQRLRKIFEHLRSKVEYEAHEVQTAPATGRLPGARYLKGRHRHGPTKDQEHRDVADANVIEGGLTVFQPLQLLPSFRARFLGNSPPLHHLAGKNVCFI